MSTNNLKELPMANDNLTDVSVNEYDLSNDDQRKEVFETLQYRIDQIDRNLSDIVMQFS